MKKLIIIITALLLCSCEPRNYNCRLDYTINYPDTTIVKCYEWNGSNSSKYCIKDHPYDDCKVLYISYANSSLIWDSKEIDAVSTALDVGGDIRVIKFRIFRKEEN